MSDPIGVKSLDEIWEELKRLSMDMPILYQFFQFERYSYTGLSREHLLAGMALNLAVALKETQEKLIDATFKHPAPILVWKEKIS